MSKISLNNIKYTIYNIIQVALHVKQVQKTHFTCRNYTFCKNFEKSDYAYSQHPYLLGFDSNLVPNSNILVFQLYPGEDSEYSEKSGRFAYSSASSLGNTPNNQENH